MVRAADELAGDHRGPHRGDQGAGQAAHAGRHGALRGRLRFRAETERIIAAYAAGHDHGVAAYSKALATSHAAPPDTDLLAWSSAMGPEERAAYDACAAAIELAVVAGELRVGVSGWKTKRAALVERWLTRPTSEPGYRHLAQQDQRRTDRRVGPRTPGRARPAGPAVVPRLLEPPVLPGEPLPTLRWLLQHADAGLG